MVISTNVRRALTYEAFGFMAIIAFSWLNELSDFARVVGNSEYIPNWRESVLETTIILAVAIPVMTLTKRFVSRLHYLEGFLRVCAWCKKLEHDGEWVAQEEYFQRKFQTLSSHAICESCTLAIERKAKTQYA